MKSEPLYAINDAGCWIWLGRRDKRGTYGMGSKSMAHREMFVLHGGEIPPGYEIDHLCLTTLCVNPAHLEPVTPEENRRRRYALIVKCVNGHPYDDENTYFRPSGWRDCRTCIRSRVRKYYKSRKQAAS